MEIIVSTRAMARKITVPVDWEVHCVPHLRDLQQISRGIRWDAIKMFAGSRDGCTLVQRGCVCTGVYACTRVPSSVTRTGKGVNGNVKSPFNFDRRSCKLLCLARINPDPVAKYDRYTDDVIVLG